MSYPIEIKFNVICRCEIEENGDCCCGEIETIKDDNGVIKVYAHDKECKCGDERFKEFDVSKLKGNYHEFLVEENSPDQLRTGDIFKGDDIVAPKKIILSIGGKLLPEKFEFKYINGPFSRKKLAKIVGSLFEKIIQEEKHDVKEYKESIGRYGIEYLDYICLIIIYNLFFKERRGDVYVYEVYFDVPG